MDLLRNPAEMQIEKNFNSYIKHTPEYILLQEMRGTASQRK
jgi:hypothetical protein